MKKILISLMIVLLTVSVAMASWITDFEKETDDLGLIPAVGNALVAPEVDEDGNEILPGPGIPQGRVAAIIENGLQLEINTVNLIMALYCNQAEPQQIIDAIKHQVVILDENGKVDEAASEEEAQRLLDAGFSKANTECSEIMADAQAYTEIPGTVGSDRLGSTTGSRATPTVP